MPAILIIEDDEILSELLKENLENAGFDAVCANSISEGFAKFHQRMPDVITLDINLPDDSGLDMLKSLKNNYDTAKIPIIVVSVAGNAAELEECGAYAYFQKPVDYTKLINSIKEAIHLY
jgi:DNA-binding response OmpR family regulator